VASGAVTEHGRADAMKRRLARTAGRLGVPEDGVDLVMAAFDLGMAPRLAAALDDHHPDYLHPSRTALILMDDAHVTEPRVIAAALVTETRTPDLAVPAVALKRLGAGVVAIVTEVPVHDSQGESLTEWLVGASLDARLVAVAERLDHARHLHLRDRDEWGPYHRITCETYSAVADRTEATLAGRIAWWCTTFKKRFMDA